MELKWAIALSVVLLSGCQREQWDDCITSAGPMRSEGASSGTFTVDLRDRINLVLKHASVRMNNRSRGSGVNLLDQVRAEVRDGVLYLENDNACKWVRSYKPRITGEIMISTVDTLSCAERVM